MNQDKEHRINGEITVAEVRVIDAQGEQLGVLPLSAALAKAEALGVDLVEVAPLAHPPVCRLMDYGKFRYRESKQKHEAKLKQKRIQVKEIKFRPGTGEHDYQIKLKHIVGFLDEGNKAKITLRFRGREMTHQQIGMDMLSRLKQELSDRVVVEHEPSLEGRFLVMVLAPKKK